MGIMAQTIAQLDKLEEENKKLKAAIEKAAEFMSAVCDSCPYDTDLGCERPERLKNIKCAEAVKSYLTGE